MMIESHGMQQYAGPRVVVVGPGALGTLFAARLALAGVPTLLLDYQPERAQALAKSGLRLHDDAGEHPVRVPVTADPRALAQVDIALVLVKAYRTDDVAALLADYLPPDAVAVTLQNGLGNVETLQRHLGSERAFGGSTTQAAILECPGVVRDTGSWPTVLGRSDGRPDARLDDVVAVLLRAGFAVSITQDLAAALWGKAILNAAINPVAALTRLRNGALTLHEPTLKLMTAAAREAAMVARKQGVRIARQDWRARLLTVCQATASNVNSMLADVLHARRTEIDAINGAIVRTAELHGLQTPINRTLWYLIAASEGTYYERVG